MKLHLHSISKRYPFLRTAKLKHQCLYLVQEICDQFFKTLGNCKFCFVIIKSVFIGG